MVSSASSFTKNLPRKLTNTNIIDISSNESSLLKANNLIPMPLTTTLTLSLTTPNASQTLPTQPIKASPLAPRALLFTTPPSSPHPYLNSLDDLPSRISNPPPLPLDIINNQTLPHTTLMNFEPSFPPTNLSRRGNRLCAQPEPFMTREQILEELRKLQDLSHDIETALHNAQNVQNGLLPQGPLPHTTTTISQMPSPSSYPITTFQTLQTSTIPPF
ncbi:hypothetical protein Tco_0596251 [Tanacetum coccineum]